MQPQRFRPLIRGSGHHREESALALGGRRQGGVGGRQSRQICPAAGVFCCAQDEPLPWCEEDVFGIDGDDCREYICQCYRA